MDEPPEKESPPPAKQRGISDNGTESYGDRCILSMVKSATATETQSACAGEVIKGIRGGRWKDSVEPIRSTYRRVLDETGGDRKKAKEAIGAAKKRLPGILWSGKFSSRANANLVKHSGLLCADLDELGDRLPDVRAALLKSPHLCALFLSPSGDGLKLLFRVRADGAFHLASYRAVERHIMELTGVQIDESCKDLARLCFASYDPDLYQNEGAVELPPLPEPTNPAASKNGATQPPDPDVRRRIATDMFGEIREIDGKSFVRCPGEHRHTQGNGAKDCEIHLDGPPSIHCVHNSCAGIVAGVNHELRSRIGKAEQPPTVDVREPRPAELPRIDPYTPPPLDLLPAVLREYVEAAAESLNVDRSFILLPMLSSLGSAIGIARSILVKRGFIQPPVIWTGIVGRSGSRKSPSLDAATFPTRERERALMASNREREHEFRETLAKWDAGRKNERGPKPEAPAPETALLDDLTLASLADAMQNNPRGLLIAKDELSHWLSSFDQFTKGAKGSDVSRYLSLHTAVFFGLDRREGGRSYRIFNPRVCITGGIQPAVLARCLTPDYFERGLPARFLFAMPPFRQDQWTEATIPEALTQAVRELFARLYALEPQRDGGETRPGLLPMDADAKGAYVEFYNQCGAIAEEENEKGEASRSKATGTAARLALVGMLLNDPDAMGVRGGIMVSACGLARWHGHEATRIYSTLGETAEQSDARRLVEYIQRRGGAVTVRDLAHGLRAYRNQTDAAEAALGRLATAGLGKWECLPSSPRGGPSKRLFRLAISDIRGVTVTETPENTREFRGYGDGDGGYVGENEETMGVRL